jgi:hypothetical protein
MEIWRYKDIEIWRYGDMEHNSLLLQSHAYALYALCGCAQHMQNPLSVTGFAGAGTAG